MDKEETPVPLPSAPAQAVATNITLQPPLSRRGHGPGLILLTEEYTAKSELLDPLPLQKWAEEGYAVVEIRVRSTELDFSRDLKLAIEALEKLNGCDDTEKIGIISVFYKLYALQPMLMLSSI